MENNNDVLVHYGTLGMKWGVRRAYKTLGNSSASSEKKAKAVTKIQRSQEKASAKLNKLDQKATKKISTAVKRKYGWGGGQKAYEKAKWKADRQAYKARNWYNAMQKTFDGKSMSKISDSDKAIGRKYIDYFMQTSEITN